MRTSSRARRASGRGFSALPSVQSDRSLQSHHGHVIVAQPGTVPTLRGKGHLLPFPDTPTGGQGGAVRTDRADRRTLLTWHMNDSPRSNDVVDARDPVGVGRMHGLHPQARVPAL